MRWIGIVTRERAVLVRKPVVPLLSTIQLVIGDQPSKRRVDRLLDAIVIEREKRSDRNEDSSQSVPSKERTKYPTESLALLQGRLLDSIDRSSLRTFIPHRTVTSRSELSVRIDEHPVEIRTRYQGVFVDDATFDLAAVDRRMWEDDGVTEGGVANRHATHYVHVLLQV